MDFDVIIHIIHFITYYILPHLVPVSLVTPSFSLVDGMVGRVGLVGTGSDCAVYSVGLVGV